jgi:GGDEF domain-containing protein
VTISGGIALYPEDGQDWDHLFAAADRRLYAAKRAGRDRVECAG